MFADVSELGGEDVVGTKFFREDGLFGVIRIGGAEGFEDAAGVVAAAHGHAACTGDFEDGVAALGDDLDKAFDIGGAAGHLEHDGFGRKVDDASAEGGGKLEELRPRVLAKRVRGTSSNLDEAEPANDGLAAANLVAVARDPHFVKHR